MDEWANATTVKSGKDDDKDDTPATKPLGYTIPGGNKPSGPIVVNKTANATAKKDQDEEEEGPAADEEEEEGTKPKNRVIPKKKVYLPEATLLDPKPRTFSNTSGPNNPPCGVAAKGAVHYLAAPGSRNFI